MRTNSLLPFVGSQAGSTDRRDSWPRHVGILNDYVRIPYANGSSFASQFLYREFTARGRKVTVLGPRDPHARPEEVPPGAICLPSLPFRNHPGVYLPFPGPATLRQVADLGLDAVLAHSGTALLDLGVWCRRALGTPFVAVNTVHLPSLYNVMLPDALEQNRVVRRVFQERIMPWAEEQSAIAYNNGDGLVVLSEGLVGYWRDRGVKVPIHVIPRSVAPSIFDRPAGADPFPGEAERGHRLLVVCRHTREKGVARLLEIFAKFIAPHNPRATLTLVGDGPDHDTFKALAGTLGVADRTYFPGEYPVTEMTRWYSHADLFVYTSLSETYGQVVSEAMWCGLPVVAFADDMGVSQQVKDGENGALLPPGPDAAHADFRFGNQVLSLLRSPERRAHLAARAARLARERCAPEHSVRRFEDALLAARDHLRDTRGDRRDNAPKHLARWTGVHGLLAALGCLRAPAVLNRHGRRQPGWSGSGAAPSSASHAAPSRRR
ncbi:MAG: glycosyltransferase, partial [Deltaproteobacteria bacterium]|nr:glycosyltransferase [Deltaproteobacteria bacterium]